MTIFSAGAAGALSLARLYQRLRPSKQSAQHLFANGKTKEIVQKIDEIEADVRADRQELAELRGNLRRLERLLQPPTG